jgi:ATP-dependent helicase HrpB
MLSDTRLHGIDVIIFDEFHERHLYGDITLARALDLQEKHRPDLKIVVMSATLDAGTLQKYLAPCELLTSGGRTFPVEVEYLARSIGDAPIWEAAADEFERIARQSEGDTLVFMPGAYEIQRTIQAIRNTRTGGQCTVLPLHGELPPAEQDAAIARYDRRKVIVSTNVAETSLTIEGVRLVIDAGLARVARFDPYRGINTLLIERISRASADQRAGRAGRTAPGRCFRLWTEREHLDRPAQELSEIKRLDLAEVVLTLKASGVADVAKFRWLEPPDPKSLNRALTLLTDLGALQTSSFSSSPSSSPAAAQRDEDDEEERDEEFAAITPLGQRMLAFPAHPRYARMLLAGHDLGCVPTVVLIAALTQGRNPLRRAEGKQMQQDRDEQLGEGGESDFFTLLRAYRFAEQRNFNPQACRPLGINALAAREAAGLAQQFLKIAREEKLDLRERDSSPEALQRCVLAGFPDMVAMRLDSGTLRCALVHGRKGVLARESVVTSALLVASEVREVEMRGDIETLLTLATAIRPEWLRELFPDGFVESTEVFFDSTLRRVLAKRQTRFRDLVLSAEQSDKVPHEQAAALLAREVEAGTCPLKSWDHAVDQWILRLNQLADWFPEYELPKLGPADRLMLVEQICFGATSYKEIKERAVWPTVKAWLSSAQQQLLEDYAPERLELPGGRKAKIVYGEPGGPTIAARIQDLYGVTGELRIAGNRIPLVIQVLAPNHRPIQITQNLAIFWKENYPKLKQELQRKYPRHEWR